MHLSHKPLPLMLVGSKVTLAGRRTQHFDFHLVYQRLVVGLKTLGYIFSLLDTCAGVGNC